MTGLPAGKARALWAKHDAQWRDTAQVASYWREAEKVDPGLLAYTVHGDWWRVLRECKTTLLVTREYEHLLMALGIAHGAPRISYMRLPHPSGIAFDEKRDTVHVASTRNPNQILDFMPRVGELARGDIKRRGTGERILMPVRARFFPGALYLHDLAMIGDALHGNAVGLNAIVRFGADGTYAPAWWPRCVERSLRPDFSRNYIQLNSIAAGRELASSFFSASCDGMGSRRPGHRNFPVDRRGVIFSGRTRRAIAGGLTRPHSARLYRGRVWVANSGYGEFGSIEKGLFAPAARLPGWTRGLAFVKGYAFVGTSRVIPRFRSYAPGIEASKSVAGIHAVRVSSGEIMGSLLWPNGNQIFALETVPETLAVGFPFPAPRRAGDAGKNIFYSFKTKLALGEA